MSYVNPPDAAYSVAPITTSDTTDLPRIPRAIYVGSGGDIDVVMADGSAALFKDVATSTILPIRPARIKASLTTAQDLIALYLAPRAMMSMLSSTMGLSLVRQARSTPLIGVIYIGSWASTATLQPLLIGTHNGRTTATTLTEASW